MLMARTPAAGSTANADPNALPMGTRWPPAAAHTLHAAHAHDTCDVFLVPPTANAHATHSSHGRCRSCDPHSVTSPTNAQRQAGEPRPRNRTPCWCRPHRQPAAAANGCRSRCLDAMQQQRVISLQVHVQLQLPANALTPCTRDRKCRWSANGRNAHAARHIIASRSRARTAAP